MRLLSGSHISGLAGLLCTPEAELYSWAGHRVILGRPLLPMPRNVGEFSREMFVCSFRGEKKHRQQQQRLNCEMTLYLFSLFLCSLQDLRNVCELLGLESYTDPQNSNPVYWRARLRRYLRSQLSPDEQVGVYVHWIICGGEEAPDSKLDRHPCMIHFKEHLHKLRNRLNFEQMCFACHRRRAICARKSTTTAMSTKETLSTWALAACCIAVVTITPL